jgi:SMODS-associating 4TM effector domain
VTATAEQQELYRAYSHSYATEAHRRRTAFLVDFGFAVVAALIAGLTAVDTGDSIVDFLSAWSPLAALLWLALRETGLLGDDKEHRRTAVVIQEQFDLTFWVADRWREVWNGILCGNPIQQRVIKDLALNYRGEPLRDDYWVDTTGIGANDAALLRIQQTAGWGAKGHARYAQLNRIPAIGALVVVLAIAAVADLKTRETAVVLFALAPFLVGRLQSARDHASLASRRETLERHIQEVLRRGTRAHEAEVRAAQDELCKMRFEHRRIPRWLYDRYADRDRTTIDAAVQWEAEILRSVQPRSD